MVKKKNKNKRTCKMKLIDVAGLKKRKINKIDFMGKIKSKRVSAANFFGSNISKVRRPIKKKIFQKICKRK